MPSDGSCIASIVSPSIDRDGWLDTLLSHKPRLTDSQSGRGFSMLRRIIQDADNPNAVNIAGIVGNHGCRGACGQPRQQAVSGLRWDEAVCGCRQCVQKSIWGGRRRTATHHDVHMTAPDWRHCMQYCRHTGSRWKEPGFSGSCNIRPPAKLASTGVKPVISP